MGLPAKCTFCGVPGKEGVQYFHVLGDVKFIKFYPLTTVWERNNFLKQEDVELFSHVGDGAKM